jgi:hypothetical protein
VSDVEVEYYDEETGETISPESYGMYDLDEADRRVYEEESQSPEPEQPIELPSWIDTVPASVDVGASRFARGIFGGLEYLEDNTTGTGLGKRLREGEEAYIKSTEDQLNALDPLSAQGLVSGGITGLTNVALNLPLPGKWLAQAGYYGAEGFGRKYGELRGEGVGEDDATNAGLITGGVDAVSSLTDV